MIAHLIRKEILEHLLELRFALLAVIGAIVIWLSLIDGYAFYRELLGDYRIAQATTETRIRQLQEADNWSEVTARGYPVNRAPSVMSIFVRGAEENLGRTITPGGGIRSVRLTRSPSATDPILGLFPALDVGLVVQVVLSLFVLLLTYDSVCGEKERGTLRLTSSYAVSRNALLIGKLLGSILPCIAAFAIPLLLGAAVVLLLPEVHLSGPHLARLGFIFLAFCLYLTAFACVGVLASVLVHRAASAFVILLAFWAVVVAVLPRTSLIIADAARPAPSMGELQQEIRAVADESLTIRHRLHQEWREDYAREHGQEWWRTPQGREGYWLYFARTREDRQAVFHPAQDRLRQDYRNRYQARLDLALDLARLSPAFAVHNAATQLAGTGVLPYQSFLHGFFTYVRDSYVRWATGTKNRDQLRRAWPEKYGEVRWDLPEMPRFTAAPRLSGADLASASIDLGILALWAILCFAASYVTMQRYDVR